MDGLNGASPLGAREGPDFDFAKMLVPPHPQMTAWSIVGVTFPTGETIVCIARQTPAGTFYDFLSADEAEARARELAHAARQARTGLVLPPSLSQTPPDGQPGGH